MPNNQYAILLGDQNFIEIAFCSISVTKTYCFTKFDPWITKFQTKKKKKKKTQLWLASDQNRFFVKISGILYCILFLQPLFASAHLNFISTVNFNDISGDISGDITVEGARLEEGGSPVLYHIGVLSHVEAAHEEDLGAEHHGHRQRKEEAPLLPPLVRLRPRIRLHQRYPEVRSDRVFSN
jgi:hypothetical protein